MPLKKTTKPTSGDGLNHGFDQARLDRLTASMQPLLTRNATEEELEALLKEAEDCLEVTMGTGTGTGRKNKRFQGWWMRNRRMPKTVEVVGITRVEDV